MRNARATFLLISLLTVLVFCAGNQGQGIFLAMYVRTHIRTYVSFNTEL